MQAAQRALPELERAEADICRSADAPNWVVRISVASYGCYYWLADFNARIRDVADDVLLELVAVGEAPSSRLDDGTADIGIAPATPTDTYDRVPTPGFEAERFLTNPQVSPETVVVVKHPAAIVEMVAAGLGIAILSRWAMKPWLDSHRLDAHRSGPNGLDLHWSALTRAGTPDDAIETEIITELASFLTPQTHSSLQRSWRDRARSSPVQDRSQLAGRR